MGSTFSTVPVQDMAGTIEIVKDFIDSDVVVIFSKSYCPFCNLAKTVFKQINQPYTAIELDNRDDGGSIQNVLKDMTGASTVPRVFIKGKCVGGGTDVKALHEKGELVKMLQ